MKKKLFIVIIGFILSHNAYADKIEYYSGTTKLVKEMGKNGTAESTFVYAPVTVITLAVETVLAPSVWFWNLFQDEKKEEN